MRSTAEIQGTLANIQRSLTRNARVVDDGALRGLVPNIQLARNIEKDANFINAAALDLHGLPEFEAIADKLGADAITVARRSGVLHAMAENGLQLSPGWVGKFGDAIGDISNAVRIIH